MPATAGRVRMPANNRVHSSAALQTHGIWQSAIGYDPYAPTKGKEEPRATSQQNVPSSEPDAENPYASFQGLLALARITGSNADEARGACKRCGRVGHLSFQCRNFLSVKDDKEKDLDAMQGDIASELSKLRGKMVMGANAVDTDSDEEDEESEDSDSDYNSEIERLIAQKSGKKSVRKERSKKKESDDDESDTDSGERKKRGRSKKRRSSKRKHDDSDDSEEDRKKRRKEKRRKRDESSDEDEKRRRRHRKSRKEKRRRRSHRYSDDSESDASEDRHRSRRSKRAATPSDSDASGSDDARVGRGRKRSYKKSGKHHRVEE